jgi:AbrB family looped-hinge helix DNA binding protein
VCGTHAVVVDAEGNVTLPRDVRERLGLVEGTALVLVETSPGLVLVTLGQLRARVRAECSGTDLVGGLLADRRAAAAAEDLA